MKRGGLRPTRSVLLGSLLFFVLIALVIQIAVLIYDYIAERTESNMLIALLMLGVIVLLSIACTVIDIFRRRLMVTHPTERILMATERIAAGDFSVQLPLMHPYGRYTEYDLIMENLNMMAAELSKSEMLKTDFISNVSHELKTPLAVIGSYAALLRDESIEPEERRRHIETMLAAVARLSNLVTNILKLNKLENRELRPETETFDLTASLEECILAHEELIEAKELTLDCELDEVHITSSRSYLELVWNNLISNAIKFTEPGGAVGVRLKRLESTVEVSVFDTGCGISPEFGARIFEKFYQGETSHSGEGNGLGLALVRKVIDILGGKITVSSEIGKGSTFTVTLGGGTDA